MKNRKGYKWSVLLVVTLVSFITNVDSTITIIGLPKIMQGLDMNVAMGLLTITSYIIASTVLLLPAGKLADIVGNKKIFIWGFIIFTIGTVLCGIAYSGISLIFYRIIQGVGAALALATATPIIIKTFPDKQLGLALGINSTSWVIGALVGPVIGGALISEYGWRTIFFITVPFAIIGVIGAFIVLEGTNVNGKFKVDFKGIISFGICLTLIMVVLSEGEAWGWTSSKTIVSFIFIIVLGIIFIVNELKVENPLFDFSLFSYKNYTIGLGITISYCIAYFSITLLLTVYLQGALHLSPVESSFLIIPLSAPQLIMGPLGGKLADNFGTEKMIITGSFILTIGFLLLGNLGNVLNVSAVVIPLIIISIANGIAWPSVAKAVLSSVPKKQSGSASGMFYTIYNLGRALSQTLVILTIELSIPSELVSRVLVGIDNFNRAQEAGNLIHSIGLSFKFFSIFFMITLILAASSLKSKMKKIA
ncbi:MFS transporter [Clostridium sp. 'White wine YQ']|uniref:MFS transporter n=1 Tax=Clostridium sp. 'White wine YQ' TaxID=3027474 RepID=UPI002366F601|nr:MFS transporter [Clostridium sp. 'White wine YQ']MDD7793367.1 MFS transporter [Clostridium sp. 'White wine YQ']